jgi:hypothetical protein
MHRAILLAACLASGTAANATSLKDFWSSRAPNDPQFQSAKSSLALEECIALEVSEKVGIPNIIHGERETVITGVAATDHPLGGARIVDRGPFREIFVGALHSGGWRNKVSAVVEGCI